MVAELCRRVWMAGFVATIVGGLWLLAAWKAELDTGTANSSVAGRAVFDLEELARASTMPTTQTAGIYELPVRASRPIVISADS
jgi:hypothetical protein